jgi:hypothetical protein
MGAAASSGGLLLGGKWGVDKALESEARIVVPEYGGEMATTGGIIPPCGEQLKGCYDYHPAPAKIIPIERPPHLVDDDSFLRTIDLVKETYHDISMDQWKSCGVVHARPTKVFVAPLLSGFGEEFYRRFYGHEPIDDGMFGVAFITRMAEAARVGKSDPYKAVAEAWYKAEFPGTNVVNDRMLEALKV